MAQVALRNVVKMFDKTPAVQGIDLDIADREFIVLVGPSGCGKTTTLRMIAGLEEATSGEIYIGDQLVLPVGIVTTLIKGDVYNWGQIMTGALLGAAPPLIIYAFLMDYYIAGLTAGATKG